MGDIDVIVVTFNSADTVPAAIRSVQGSPRIEGAVVVDNASADESADAARTAGVRTVIENTTNVGFASAVNQALAVCSASYVLLLNPDARIEPTSLDLLAAVLDADGRAVMAGPLLVGENGRLELGARRFSTAINRLLWHMPLPRRPQWATPEYADAARMAASPAPLPVDYLWGAALLARRSFLNDIGGLDERFFLYSEDEDLGRHARMRGFASLLVPRARATHLGGASTPDAALALARAVVANALLLEKWEGPRAACAYRRGMGPMLAIRLLLLRAVGRTSEAALATRTRSLLRSARR